MGKIKDPQKPDDFVKKINLIELFLVKTTVEAQTLDIISLEATKI